jgi:hypothetical protein
MTTAERIAQLTEEIKELERIKGLRPIPAIIGLKTRQLKRLQSLTPPK